MPQKDLQAEYTIDKFLWAISGPRGEHGADLETVRVMIEAIMSASRTFVVKRLASIDTNGYFNRLTLPQARSLLIATLLEG